MHSSLAELQSKLRQVCFEDLRCSSLPEGMMGRFAPETMANAGRQPAGSAITSIGRQLLQLGTHPRLGHMLLKAKERGLERLACDIAALVEERDIMARDAASADLEARLERLERYRRAGPKAVPAADGFRCSKLCRLAQAWLERLEPSLARDGSEAQGQSDFSRAGILLSFAYPDRIARRRENAAGAAVYLLSGGGSARLRAADPLQKSEYLIVARIHRMERSGEGSIELAAHVEGAEIAAEFAAQVSTECSVTWDARQKQVTAEQVTRIGSLVLERKPAIDVSPEEIARTLLSATILQSGTGILNWSEEAKMLQGRAVTALHANANLPLPDLREESLGRQAEEWLLPHIIGIRTLEELQQVKAAALLRARFSWDQHALLDRVAPASMVLPNGRTRLLDYSSPALPVLAATVQELFGWPETPKLGDGTLQLGLHILSPARRPIQITKDLGNFWRNTYADVRKELRGRYPKHYWPEDPLTAEPGKKR